MKENNYDFQYDYDNFDNWTANEIPTGFVAPEGGSSFLYHTGTWRTQRPVWDSEACKNCMLCWVYCPDASIQTVDGKMTGIDLDHCKGCGLCVKECKFNALKMINEAEAKEA